MEVSKQQRLEAYNKIRENTLKKLSESNSLGDKVLLTNILKEEREYHEYIKKRKSKKLTREDIQNLEEQINIWYERLKKTKNKKPDTKLDKKTEYFK